MYLLSRAPIIDVNPSDGKEYEYILEFINIMNAKNTQYLYKFKRSAYPIDGSSNHRMTVGQEDPFLLIELDEGLDSDLEKICERPGKYWYYYWNKYNHYTPKKIYCKFDNEHILRYLIDRHDPRVIEKFNTVLRMIDVNDGPKYGFRMPVGDNATFGWGPIFEINVFVPRGKTIAESLTEDIRQIIKEYTDNITKGDNEDGEN